MGKGYEVGAADGVDMIQPDLVWFQSAHQNIGIGHFPQQYAMFELPGEKFLQCLPKHGDLTGGQRLTSMFKILQGCAGAPVEVANVLPDNPGAEIGFDKAVAAGNMPEELLIMLLLQLLGIDNIDRIIVERFFPTAS